MTFPGALSCVWEGWLGRGKSKSRGMVRGPRKGQCSHFVGPEMRERYSYSFLQDSIQHSTFKHGEKIMLECINFFFHVGIILLYVSIIDLLLLFFPLILTPKVS